uniref:Secreted peptide n=1 Tax=Guillardia theta TaxID=55529 RepID=A0A6U5VPD3_GUITH
MSSPVASWFAWSFLSLLFPLPASSSFPSTCPIPLPSRLPSVSASASLRYCTKVTGHICKLPWLRRVIPSFLLIFIPFAILPPFSFSRVGRRRRSVVGCPRLPSRCVDLPDVT